MIRRAALAVALQVAAPAAAAAEADDVLASDLRLELHGYFRTRVHSIHEILPSEGLTTLDYVTQRLRIEPALVYGPNRDKPIAALRLQIDALDDVVWGDNAGRAPAPVFATDPSVTSRAGAEIPSVELKRAWLELRIPVGQIRVGRMASHWGLGLLSNAGDGFDDDFGDNRMGSTFDRVLFATRPVNLVRGIASGAPGPESPLVLAFAYDKIVEDPVGEAGVGSGLPRDGRADFLARGADDVQEWVGVLLYDNPALGRREGDTLRAGVYVVYRWQESTNSAPWIPDFHARLRLGHLYAETEILFATGHTQAIRLPAPPDDAPPGTLAERKSVRLFGGVVRGGYLGDRYDVVLEIGHASGDPRSDDPLFTGRALHPDHRVGLLLYPEVLAALTRLRWDDPNARGLWSQGGVYNSTYFMPTLRVRPIPGVEFVLSQIVAVADELDGAVFPRRGSALDEHACRRPDEHGPWNCGGGSGAFDPHVTGAGRSLGFETDLAVKIDWLDHFKWSVETGVLVPGAVLRRIPNSGDDLAWTLQTRLAMTY